MAIYNFFLTKIILPISEKILNIEYSNTISKWFEYDLLNEQELQHLQNENLKKILKHALSNVPYYKKYNYDNSISAIDNLKKLPILTKEILREENTRLVSSEHDINSLQKNFSSGSSGVQSFSYNDKKNKYLIQAIQGHWYQWSGYKIGDPILQFGISPNRIFPKNLKDIFYRTYYQNAFSLENKDYDKIYTHLNKTKNLFIIGYPSAINEYANYLIERKLKHPVVGIISLGDKLFPHFEKNFKIAFELPKIIDTYGCAEGLMMACRSDLSYYYIMSPHVFIEIVDDNDNEVDDGQLGHVLVTCFTNFAQPFIRYKLGDLAIKLPKKEYPEKRDYMYPLLKKIIGRETDLVKTPNGKTLIVHSFTGIFEYYPEIKQYRIIQEVLSKITIEYITDSYINFNSNTLAIIKDQIDGLTENSLSIEFIEVNEIPSTPSGKPQIIKSLL